jgi:hypothetical protein
MKISNRYFTIFEEDDGKYLCLPKADALKKMTPEEFKLMLNCYREAYECLYE